MSITHDVVNTLRSEDHGHAPIIVFEPRSQDGVLRIVDGDVSPTLNTMRGGKDSRALWRWEMKIESYKSKTKENFHIYEKA